jgi:hypothetical protein
MLVIYKNYHRYIHKACRGLVRSVPGVQLYWCSSDVELFQWACHWTELRAGMGRFCLSTAQWFCVAFVGRACWGT